MLLLISLAIQGKTKSLYLGNDKRKHQRSHTHHLVSTENLIQDTRDQEFQEKLVSNQEVVDVEVNLNNNNLADNKNYPFASVDKV